MWIPMSERLLNKLGDDIMFNPQPDCQYNPITGEVIKESDKVSAVKEKPIDVTEKSNVVKESDKAPSLDVFKYKRKTELPKDNQKDNPKDKESDKAPVVAAVVSDESDKTTVAAPILKEKTADVIEKSIVVKESDKAPIVKESDKVPVVKESDKAMVFGHVLKEKPVDVIEKSTVVNEKEKSAVDVMSKVPKDKEKPTVDVMSKVGKSKAIVHNDKALDVVSKDKPKGNPPPVVGKGNAPSVIGKAKDKPSVLQGKVPTELPKKKHKADIPKDKPKPKDKHKEDRSKKKLELKTIKGKMVSDEVDSDEVLVRFTMFPLIKYRRGWEGIPVGGISLFSLDVRPIEHEFVRSWFDQFYPKSLKEIRVDDIASKVISAQQVDFLFKVNFLTLFTNTMGRVAGLKGHICLNVVRRLREESVISEIDWCGYIHSCLEDSKLPEKPTLHYLGPFTFLILLYLDFTKFDRFPVLRTRPAIRDWTSTLMRKRQDLETKEHVIRCLDLHNEWTESKLQETEGLTRVSSLETSEREVRVNLKAEEKLTSICSERVVLKDLIRKASLDYPGDQKFVELQEKYVQVFRDPISFDVDVNFVDGGNDSDGDDDNDDGNGNGNNDEELNDDNDDGNGNNDEELNDDNDDGNGNNDEELNDDNDDGNGNNDEGLNDEDTLALSSPYMNKKTKVVPKITRLEFNIGNGLFTMQGDKIENVFETHSGGFGVYGIRLNLETLAPGLWIDANVIDCWGAILNHEEKFQDAESKSRHLFPTGCISKSMFDGTLPSDDDKWGSFSNQVKAQFKGNEESHVILNESHKKLFARHLKLYGHSRHGTVGRLKHKILKLKWRTSGNFHDCGVFTMLHMESFNGETAAKWDCGLSVESGLQCDMLRRLRFKFATKILLHEINVHSKKMLELANEFDKVDSLERMAIIVEAVKNREERDRI
ncbi:peptidase C48, SUMO/sentrin/Ubl1 [Tanacetum coccineum]